MQTRYRQGSQALPLLLRNYHSDCIILSILSSLPVCPYLSLSTCLLPYPIFPINDKQAQRERERETEIERERGRGRERDRERESSETITQTALFSLFSPLCLSVHTYLYLPVSYHIPSFLSMISKRRERGRERQR